MRRFKEISDYNAFLDFKIRGFEELKKKLGKNQNVLHLKKEVIEDYQDCYLCLKRKNFTNLSQLKMNLSLKLAELSDSNDLDDKDIIMFETLHELKKKLYS